jgi:hypothetical protein
VPLSILLTAQVCPDLPPRVLSTASQHQALQHGSVSALNHSPVVSGLLLSPLTELQAYGDNGPVLTLLDKGRGLISF